MGRGNPWIVHLAVGPADLTRCGVKGQRSAGFAFYELERVTCSRCRKLAKVAPASSTSRGPRSSSSRPTASLCDGEGI